MRHQQYRESILERLRLYRSGNPDATLTDARKALRPTLDDSDIDLLFDNWLNGNFDRISVQETGGKVVATIRTHRMVRDETHVEKLERKRQADLTAARLARDTKENLFGEFAARIWAMTLPHGVVMREAKGRDMVKAGGWFTRVAKHVKPGEKVFNKLSTRQLFNLSQQQADAA